jgi:zinc D-Ala-D-Ala dipeptidase
MKPQRARSGNVTRLSAFLAAILVLLSIGPTGCSEGKQSDTPNRVETAFIDAGLVDIATIDSSIQVDLVNSNKRKNFFREDFYDGLSRAYVQRAVARKLAKAQAVLRSRHPDLSLLIMDAARPNSVSFEMYEKMRGTRFEKYVADPHKGSMHNYGAAVDVTIVSGTGKRLDMGFIPFYKGKLGIALSYLFSRKGRLTTEQKPSQGDDRSWLHPAEP